jgi:hypothetical protein
VLNPLHESYTWSFYPRHGLHKGALEIITRGCGSAKMQAIIFFGESCDLFTELLLYSLQCPDKYPFRVRRLQVVLNEICANVSCTKKEVLSRSDNEKSGDGIRINNNISGMSLILVGLILYLD